MTNSKSSGQNVFVDFKIIEDSNKEKLAKEFDVLLRAGKKIFIWSKTKHPLEMKKYCLSIRIPINEEELKIHAEVKELRKKGKAYQDIANILKIDVKMVGYYVQSPIVHSITLDDWIIDYYPKDSSFYEKADIIVDPDPDKVRRFKIGGYEANYIEKIV